MKVTIENDTLRRKKEGAEVFVTFDVRLTTNHNKLIVLVLGCMYAQGRILSPRRMVRPGYYQNSADFGAQLYQAVYDQVLQHAWWDRWDGVTQPLPLDSYVQDENNVPPPTNIEDAEAPAA